MPTTPDNKKTEPTDTEFDALEFELVDLDTARGALDEVPAGVVTWFNVSADWTARRRPSTATDRALTWDALDWLSRLPVPVRPEALRMSYPRVINALAARWADRAARDAYLEDLLQDKRGGRRGFPPDIVNELRRVNAYAQGLPLR
jgi:hypothetical protein